MKVLYDLFPLLLFFITYKFFGIYAATAVAIVASTLQLAYTWHKKKRIEFMQVTTTVLIVVFGGLTLYLHDVMFIKWKPSIINWVLASVFFISHYVGDKPMIKRILEEKISMPNEKWVKLSWIWIQFFMLVGAANCYVIYHFSTDQWVSFKVFGLTFFAIIFGIYQANFISKNATFIPANK